MLRPSSPCTVETAPRDSIVFLDSRLRFVARRTNSALPAPGYPKASPRPTIRPLLQSRGRRGRGRPHVRMGTGALEVRRRRVLPASSVKTAFEHRAWTPGHIAHPSRRAPWRWTLGITQCLKECNPMAYFRCPVKVKPCAQLDTSALRA